jgi:hypothetical protein
VFKQTTFSNPEEKKRLSDVSKAGAAFKTDEGKRNGRLVGASVLDVAGLLAAIADTLGGSLGGTISGKMADFTTYTIC